MEVDEMIEIKVNGSDLSPCEEELEKIIAFVDEVISLSVDHKKRRTRMMRYRNACIEVSK